MKIPKTFVEGNLDLKIEEFLTKKKRGINPYKEISMLQLKVIKDYNRYYITYDTGEPQTGVEKGSTVIIAQPGVKVEKSWLKSLIRFSDAIRDYHGDAYGTSVGPKDREKNKGGISKIYLRHHLNTAELMDTIKEFYSLNVNELELLKIKYKQ